MTRVLAVFVAGWHVLDALSPSAVLLAAAALAVAGLVVLVTRHLARHVTPGAPAPSRASRAGYAIVVRLCDPSAPGRPRPRAPSARAGAAPA